MYCKTEKNKLLTIKESLYTSNHYTYYYEYKIFIFNKKNFSYFMDINILN